MIDMTRRLLATVVLLLGGILVVHAPGGTEQLPPRQPLDRLPFQLGGWRGGDDPIEKRIVEAVGVDDYLSRVYRDPSGNAVQIYIGYYKSQKTGDTFHSPKNCLPGGGWLPVSSETLTFSPAPGERVAANEYVVEKGLDSDLVIYWYQLQGRAVESEYWAKVWMVIDAMTRHRTDGALVRICVPMTRGKTAAIDQGVALARLIYPRLADFVPD